MLDPPRPEVKDAIKTCKLAGIRVIMITGDNKLTADSVAKEIGLETEENISLQSYTAKDFFEMNEKDQIRILTEAFSLVISRSEPHHKMNLINLLKKKCVNLKC